MLKDNILQYEAIIHLLQNGYTRIAAVAGSESYPSLVSAKEDI